MKNKIINYIQDMSNKELEELYKYIWKKEEGTHFINLKNQQALEIKFENKTEINIFSNDYSKGLTLNTEYSELLLKPEASNRINLKIIPDKRTEYLNRKENKNEKSI